MATSTSAHPQQPLDSSLVDTYQKWLHLHAQLQQYEIKLRSVQEATLPSSVVVEDADVVEGRISELNEKLLQMSTDNMIRNVMLQSLQFSDVLNSRCFPAKDGDDVDSELRKSLATTTSLASDVLRIQKEVKELQSSLTKLKHENRELSAQCRELMHANEKRKADRLGHLAPADEHQCKRMQERNEELVNKLELVHNSFLGLILGSGINWAEDAQLTDIVRALGAPMECDLT